MIQRSLTNQRGIALVQAIFVLVVLAALGAFMVRISGVQSHTVSLAAGGAQAYQAARGGIEWGIARVQTTGSCAGVGSNQTIDGFTVTVTCQATAVSEGGVNYNVFSITAFAQRGTYGNADFFSRRIEVKVTGP